MWVACGALALAGLFQPIGMWLATRDCGGTWRHVAAVYIPPLLISATALLPLGILRTLLPLPAMHWWALAATAVFTFPPTYFVLARVLRSGDVKDLLSHARGIARRA